MSLKTLRLIAAVLIALVLFVTLFMVWWMLGDRPPRTQLEADLMHATDTVEASPSDPKAFEQLGYVYMRAGRYEDALQAFDDAIALDDQDGVLHYDRAEALLALDRSDDAIEAAEKAIELYKNLQPAYLLIGEVLSDRGDWEEALPYLEKASTIEDTDMDARFMYAKALLATGDAESALMHFQVVESVLPDYPGLKEELDALR